MKLLNWTRRFSRRGFLASSATAVAAVAATGGTVLVDAQAASPEDARGLRPEEIHTLLKFTRDLFPHDRLDDSFYTRAVAPLQEEAVKDAPTRRLLSGGVEQLNRLAVASLGKPYADVPNETARVAIIKKIETGAFFNKVYNDAIVGLYNQP
jgi:hypothetical protein